MSSPDWTCENTSHCKNVKYCHMYVSVLVIYLFILLVILFIQIFWFLLVCIWWMKKLQIILLQER